MTYLEGAKDVDDEGVTVGQVSHDVMLGSQMTPIRFSLTDLALNKIKNISIGGILNAFSKMSLNWIKAT